LKNGFVHKSNNRLFVNGIFLLCILTYQCEMNQQGFSKEEIGILEEQYKREIESMS